MSSEKIHKVLNSENIPTPSSEQLGPTRAYVSDLIEEVMRVTGWKEGRLAEEVGTSQPTINRWKKKHNSAPVTAETALRTILAKQLEKLAEAGQDYTYVQPEYYRKEGLAIEEYSSRKPILLNAPRLEPRVQAAKMQQVIVFLTETKKFISLEKFIQAFGKPRSVFESWADGSRPLSLMAVKTMHHDFQVLPSLWFAPETDSIEKHLGTWGIGLSQEGGTEDVQQLVMNAKESLDKAAELFGVELSKK